jgi:hypothetical protein
MKYIFRFSSYTLASQQSSTLLFCMKISGLSIWMNAPSTLTKNHGYSWSQVGPKLIQSSKKQINRSLVIPSFQYGEVFFICNRGASNS